MLRILDIIGYSEDKEKFASSFLENTNLQAFINLLTSLSQEKRDEINQKFMGLGNDTAKMQKELKTYFAQSQLEQAIENSSRNAITEYMKAIDPTLSDSQKGNLANYFAEISKTAPPPPTTV